MLDPNTGKDLRVRSVPKEISEEIKKIIRPGHRIFGEAFIVGSDHGKKKWYYISKPTGMMYIVYFDGERYNNTEFHKYAHLLSGEGVKLKGKEMDDYIKITSYNEKDMIKIGRTLHVIMSNVHYRTELIRPCLRPDQDLIIKNGTKYDRIGKQEEDFDRWKDWNRGLVDWGLMHGILYVNKKQKLAEFSWK